VVSVEKSGGYVGGVLGAAPNQPDNANERKPANEHDGGGNDALRDVPVEERTGAEKRAVDDRQAKDPPRERQREAVG